MSNKKIKIIIIKDCLQRPIMLECYVIDQLPITMSPIQEDLGTKRIPRKTAKFKLGRSNFQIRGFS